MPVRNESLKNALLRSQEITITVVGRKSGRPISNPVWFVLEGENLYLVPVKGSATQWYKNVLNHPKIRIQTKGGAEELQATPIIDPGQVSSVVEKFRAKYGAGDVKKYYSKFDVAVAVQV